MKCKHKDCEYRGCLSTNTEYCDYISHVGLSRNCDPENCNKYRKRETPRGKGQIGIVITTDREKIRAYREGVGS